ncbi:MAG TPA: hypothetical protein VHJ34_00160 [Actinomycetota bacterium]|nr:hypothetical protein [Actinomycetota bacterium]
MRQRLLSSLRDDSGMISAFLVRIVVAFVVVGVLVVDAGSMLVNTFTLDSTANDIALEVSGPFTAGSDFRPDPVRMQLQARELAHDAGARLLKARLRRDGTVFVKLRRAADTLVAGRVGVLDGWVTVTADGEAGEG